MGDILKFERVVQENVEIGKAKAEIAVARQAVDAALQVYLATIYENADVLFEEDIMDIALMTESTKMLAEAMIINPEDLTAHVQVKDWMTHLFAYYETQQLEEDDDELH